MVRILLLGSQHGDEHLGEKLYEYLGSHHPELGKYVEFLIANPRARAKNVRYLESDMNRSYSGKNETYEERRAAEILKYINESNFDLVLDLHTTVCEQPPCLIMASINPRNTRFIQASSITKLVVISNPLVNTALGGVCPQVVSVEVNHSITDDLLEDLCGDIYRYTKSTSLAVDKYAYEVSELLSKNEVSDEEASKLRNFTLSEKGFYPVLVGENSYQKYYNYRGFKAYKRYRFKV